MSIFFLGFEKNIMASAVRQKKTDPPASCCRTASRIGRQNDLPDKTWLYSINFISHLPEGSLHIQHPPALFAPRLSQIRGGPENPAFYLFVGVFRIFLETQRGSSGHQGRGHGSAVFYDIGVPAAPHRLTEPGAAGHDIRSRRHDIRFFQFRSCRASA